jgi:predicted TIM-barrel fold metal-dependent hydrolase
LIIDADTHITPKDAYDYIDGPLDALRPRFTFNDKGFLTTVDFPGKPAQLPGATPSKAPGTGSTYPGMSHMDARLEAYRQLGIEKQVLFPQYSAMRFDYLIEPELAAAMAHSYNLSIVKLLKEYPDQLIGGAQVALQDVPSAIREMEWAKQNGFAAVALDKVIPVHTHCYSEPYGQHKDRLRPFFKRAAELGMPLLLHSNGSHGHRLTNLSYYQHDGLWLFAPVEGHSSLMSFVTSGILDEFPDLKLVFTEAGTAFLKPMLQRFDASFDHPLTDYDAEEAATRSWRTGKPATKALVPMEQFSAKNKHPASHYFRKNIFFTIETEEEGFAEAVQYLGASQFLFATDYPHDDAGERMKMKDVELLKQNPGISEEDKETIRWRSSAALFGA